MRGFGISESHPSQFHDSTGGAYGTPTASSLCIAAADTQSAENPDAVSTLRQVATGTRLRRSPVAGPSEPIGDYHGEGFGNQRSRRGVLSRPEKVS